MPRRSIETIGRVFSTSVPERVSHTGNWIDDGRSHPVVMTSGPASGGVCGERARTTPMVTVPVALSIGSRSASNVAQSSVTPTGGAIDTSENSRDVQSRQDRSFFGASIGGGPFGGGVVAGLPWGSGRSRWRISGWLPAPARSRRAQATVATIAAAPAGARKACRPE